MELIWSNVALSRALLGQWSRVGSFGRVYIIVVDTFEENIARIANAVQVTI